MKTTLYVIWVYIFTETGCRSMGQGAQGKPDSVLFSFPVYSWSGLASHSVVPIIKEWCNRVKMKSKLHFPHYVTYWWADRQEGDHPSYRIRHRPLTNCRQTVGARHYTACKSCRCIRTPLVLEWRWHQSTPGVQRMSELQSRETMLSHEALCLTKVGHVIGSFDIYPDRWRLHPPKRR